MGLWVLSQFSINYEDAMQKIENEDLKCELN